MYLETRLQRLERQIGNKKLKDQVSELWRELRHTNEELESSENKRADLMDALQDAAMAGEPGDQAYLRQVYEKHKTKALYSSIDNDNDGEAD